MNRLENINLADTLILITLIFIGNILRSAQLKYFIAIFESNITFIHSFYLTVGCTLLNYLPMNVGMVIKARALKNNLGLNYTRFVSLSAVEILITIIISSCLGLAVLIFQWETLDFNQLYPTIFFLIILMISLFVFLLPSAIFTKYNNKIIIFLRKFLVGMEQIRRKPIDLINVFFFVLVRLLLVSVHIFICFSMLGTKIPFWGSIFISSVTAVLMIINITPAGIGVREILIGAISSISGTGFELGVLVSGIYRICAMIIHTVIGIPGLIILKFKKIL